MMTWRGAEDRTLQQHAAVGDGRAVPGRRGLEQVAALLHGLYLRGGDLLGRHLGGGVRRGVGGDDQQLGAVPHRGAPAVGVEDLVRDHRPEGGGRGGQQPGPGAGHRVEGHGREVAQVGEEAPVGHVLAEGDPVDLLEAGDDGSVRTPGHDLVSERRGRDGLGHAHHQGGVERPGQIAQYRLLGRLGQQGVQRDHVLGPQDQLGRDAMVELAQQLGGRHLRGQHHARVDLGLAEPPRPATLDGRGGHRGDRRPTVRRVVGTDGQRHQTQQGDSPDQGQGAEAGDGVGQKAPGPPTARWVRICLGGGPGLGAAHGGGPRAAPGIGASEGPRPGAVPHGTHRGLGQRSHSHATEVHGQGQAQRSPETGHAEDRPAGLAEEDTPERKPAEGPGHPHRLGQGEGGREGQGPGQRGAGRHDEAGHRGEEGLDGDEHDGAGHGERPGPHETGHVAPEPGHVPGPQPCPWPKAAQPPPQEPGGGEGQDPPSPRREREGQPRPGGQGGEGDHAPPRMHDGLPPVGHVDA